MNPHVSDEQIRAIRSANTEDYERPCPTECMRDLRDLYEPLVTSQKERIAALEEALRNILEEYDDESVLMRTPIAYFKKFDAARDLLTPKTTDPK